MTASEQRGEQIRQAVIVHNDVCPRVIESFVIECWELFGLKSEAGPQRENGTASTKQTVGLDMVSIDASVQEPSAAAVARGAPHLGGHNEPGQGFGGRVVEQCRGRQCQPGLCADQRCHLRQYRHTARNQYSHLQLLK